MKYLIGEDDVKEGSTTTSTTLAGIPGSELFRQTERYTSRLQARICDALEGEETAPFAAEQWDRRGGGGGLSRIICGGSVFEKGGVNVASVHGDLPEAAAERLGADPQPFAACGISLVLHPRSPRIPSVHMNLRQFELGNGVSWFGGGIDITPYYPYPDDCAEFHRVLKDAVNGVCDGAYERFKEECDKYFYLPHRNEMRGAGGIFFDYLKDDLNRNAELVHAVGDKFLPAYLPLVQRRKGESYSEEDRTFQLFRRGRYVEFNLLYDRGTYFGLQTGGRAESVLMSLPPSVEFPYNWRPASGSIHAGMSGYYQPRDWASY